MSHGSRRRSGATSFAPKRAPRALGAAQTAATAARLRDDVRGGTTTLAMRWMIVSGAASDRPTVPACARACLAHAPCARDGCVQVLRADGNNWSDFKRGWGCLTFDGAIELCSAREVRKERCGGVCAVCIGAIRAWLDRCYARRCRSWRLRRACTCCSRWCGRPMRSRRW